MKQTHLNDPITHSAFNVMHEAIATKAYEQWIREGKPENQADAIWYSAEQELLTGHRESSPKPAGLPVSL